MARSSVAHPSDWQDAFAREVEQKDTGRWLFTAPTGGGKTVTILQVLSHFRERNPDARVFCAVPSPSGVRHFAERLRRWSHPSDLIEIASANWYRNHQTKRQPSKTVVLGGSFGAGKTYLFSESLLQRPTALDALCETRWDLGVMEDVDLEADGAASEPQGKGPSLRHAIATVLSSGRCDRFVATSREEVQPFSKPLEVVRRDEPFIEGARDGLTLVRSALSYERSDAEQALHRKLDAIGDYLASDAPQSLRLQNRSFEKQTSSLYSLDQWIYELERLARTSKVAETASFPVVRESRSSFRGGVEALANLWNDAEEAQTWVEELFASLEAIDTDPKFDRLTQFVEEESPSHLCCITYDASTKTYLEVGLKEEGHTVIAVGENDSLNGQEKTLNTFAEQGGVLVVTDAVLPELNLIEADAVVHYDLPKRTGPMQRRLSAVLPRGEETVLPSYAFHDTTRSVDGEDQLLRQYDFLKNAS